MTQSQREWLRAQSLYFNEPFARGAVSAYRTTDVFGS